MNVKGKVLLNFLTKAS